MNLLKFPIYLHQLVSGQRKIKVTFEKVEKIENFGSYLLDKNFNSTNNNNSIYKQMIAVDGIAACAGSSAITDFFGEFSNCTALGGVDENENPERGQENSYELDFFRDYHGILELEKICDFDGNRILHGNIKDFIKLVEKNYKSGIKFYGEYYLAQTQIFLKQLLDFYFPLNSKDNEYFVKKISKEEYRKIAHNYIKALLDNVSSKDFLVLDNLCSISNPDKDVLSDYFDNYKIITSIRDPRDLYTTIRTYPAFELTFVPKDPHIFVKYYKWYAERYQYKNNPNVKLIRFEEFVFDYDRVASEIIDFCNLDAKNHIKKFAYFNPDKSKNNIVVYKNYKDQDAIRIIESELKEYLYEGK